MYNADYHSHKVVEWKVHAIESLFVMGAKAEEFVSHESDGDTSPLDCDFWAQYE